MSKVLVAENAAFKGLLPGTNDIIAIATTVVYWYIFAGLSKHNYSFFSVFAVKYVVKHYFYRGLDTTSLRKSKTVQFLTHCFCSNGIWEGIPLLSIMISDFSFSISQRSQYQIISTFCQSRKAFYLAVVCCRVCYRAWPLSWTWRPCQISLASKTKTHLSEQFTLVSELNIGVIIARLLASSSSVGDNVI